MLRAGAALAAGLAYSVNLVVSSVVRFRFAEASLFSEHVYERVGLQAVAGTVDLPVGLAAGPALVVLETVGKGRAGQDRPVFASTISRAHARALLIDVRVLAEAGAQVVQRFLDEAVGVAAALDAAVLCANASWRADMAAFGFGIGVELVRPSVRQAQTILPNSVVVCAALAFVVLVRAVPEYFRVMPATGASSVVAFPAVVGAAEIASPCELLKAVYALTIPDQHVVSLIISSKADLADHSLRLAGAGTGALAQNARHEKLAHEKR